MFDPISTYRIQFHKGFTFADFDQVIPYLQQLGIRTVYASPIFTAVPGSVHGYDITDPCSINPEVGTLQQLRALSARLKTLGIGWVQDIVPNHMALHADNRWLMDVLAKGASSGYAPFFDIDWEHPLYKNRLVLPILGTTPGEAIAAGDVALVLKDDVLALKVYDAILPLDAESVKGQVPAESGHRLEEILGRQHYVLAHWQATDTQINYRRFFTINGLISLNIQNEAVFNAHHSLVRSLCDEGIFQGLRIDHIDGLYDPTEYLFRLRRMAGKDCYIVVEKILEEGEKMPAAWPVQGTTGYDFLGIANNIFTNAGSRKKFSTFYKKLTRGDKPYMQLQHDRKALILSRYMQGELDNLYGLFAAVTAPAALSSLSRQEWKDVIGEFLVQCPVYKYYGDQLPLTGDEAQAVRLILGRIKLMGGHFEAGAELLEEIFLAGGDPRQKDGPLRFYKRCMQFTGPLMAKGVEDTLMYGYNRFIGHNDVGDSPHSFGLGATAFHTLVAERRRQWPNAMNATSTHDTKRGEDARARLNALTDMPDEWLSAVKAWFGQYPGKSVDVNDAYFIYQSIVASHPMPGITDDSFAGRFKEYIQKALREAKTHTEWAVPDKAYEDGVAAFIESLLADGSAFLQSFAPFHRRVADAGIVNSLSQVLLRFTAPGMPDTYQGTELWDLSMVDPDNRRPVDYDLRRQWLEELAGGAVRPGQLWDGRYDGKVKLWLIYTLLQARSERQALFATGAYTPVEVKGKYKTHVLAYARKNGAACCVVVIPLGIASLAVTQQAGINGVDWADTSIVLPEGVRGEWQNVLMQTKVGTAATLYLKDLFHELPLAMLASSGHVGDRKAGMLMPVFSLPSPFGVGDYGPEAYRFADFLAASGQRYWQLLPLSPTQRENGHSPYSSISGMAGNTLFISPELLAQEGLLEQADLSGCSSQPNDRVDYQAAEAIRDKLCSAAYNRYLTGRFTALRYGYEDFCRDQAYWLDDFALFVVIRALQGSKPWYEWDAGFRQRKEPALAKVMAGHAAAIDKVKWLQFIADKQWREIRSYCNRNGIALFGDMPFYMSYDSAEVWAHRAIFSLDNEGRMTGVAGVPPDYFTRTGQLWGMPTYRWDVLAENNYQWWMDRLRRNLELFDIVRLDHFRAFEAYWDVPAGEETAVHGQWIKGPGTVFFDKVRAIFGRLPFIAEDLGYEMEDVYALREKTGLPGMKVLEFAWGDNLPVSVDAPHNYGSNCIAYTGTHDNNTVLGWYRRETTKADRKRLETYTGIKVGERNVSDLLCRLAYGSVADVAILPVQDLLGYDEGSRINTPGSSADNWLWRLTPGALTYDKCKKLKQWAAMYNR